MNFSQLTFKFNYSINWNAFLYATHKITSTIITFLLFGHLDTYEFSAWANINSIVFLLLLWVDCGFRKSIPRYYPEFSQSDTDRKRFITTIIVFQLSIIIISIPLLLWITSRYYLATNFQRIYIFYALPIIYVIEGIVAIVRLIYHSQFLQKEFNSISSVLLVAESCIIISMVTYHAEHLLEKVLMLKILTGTSIACITLMMLKDFSKHEHQYNTNVNEPKRRYRIIMKEFIYHSGAMWFNNNLKSLSERNFLVPLLTFSLGPQAANIYKIANDGALFFQRMILKTIGISDTAFLSYIEASPQREKLMPIAFKKLTTKIIALCIPLLGVVVMMSIMMRDIWKSSYVFQIFFIITISYLLEIMLLPYERVLEVKRKYRYLLVSYLPYIAVIIMITSSSLVSLIGIRNTITLLCCVRLVSMLFMIYFNHNHGIATFLFPGKIFAHIGIRTFLICSLLYYVGYYLGFNTVVGYRLSTLLHFS